MRANEFVIGYHAATTGRLVRLAVSVLGFAVVYFLYGRQLLAMLGIHMSAAVEPTMVPVLLAVAVVPAGLAVAGYRADGPASPHARMPAIGAFALVATAIVFAGLLPYDLAWGVVMLAGLFFGLGRLTLRWVRGRATKMQEEHR